MYKIEDSTLRNAYKPYDIITDKKGNVGFIQEVNVNTCQESPDWQIQYAVDWMVGDNDTHAWFDHNELTKHGNIFIKIAENSCHPSGDSKRWVQELMKI